MQGRLLPPSDGCFQCFPRDAWREEFPLAALAGLDAIEWIYDLRGADMNPIGTDDGIREMKALSRQNNVAVVSICADYFMGRPFATATTTEFAELTNRLQWLLTRSHVAGIARIVLPFVDSSQMETVQQQRKIAELLRQIRPYAEEAHLEVHLETSLGPEMFAQFLHDLPYSFLKATYDSGNSASLGYDVREELASYGNRIGSVHIKDRVRSGGTVPLGTGDADLTSLLTGLSSIAYQGDYVLQVARGETGGELDWAKRNREFLERQLALASNAAARVRR